MDSQALCGPAGSFAVGDAALSFLENRGGRYPDLLTVARGVMCFAANF